MPSSIRIKRVVVGIASSLILLLGAGRAIVGKAPRKQASLPKQIQQRPQLQQLLLQQRAGFVSIGKPKLGRSNLPKLITDSRISFRQRVPLERSKPLITWVPKQRIILQELPKKLTRGEARFHPRRNDKLIFIGRIIRYGIPPQAVIICEGNLNVVEDRYGLSISESRYGLEVIC